jgi:conjugative transfer pilus assembly protein TraH
MNLRHGLLSALLVLLVTLCASTPAMGGVDEEMRSAFNSMTYQEDPHVEQGVRRNVISGGAFGFRSPQETFNFATFERPSMRGGCGSLDIFGGSFTIISAEQIVTMLKGVASAAYAYVFKLALRVISDQIANEMGEWFDKLNLLNTMSMNTCEAGEKFAAALAYDAGIREVDGKMVWSNVETGNAADDAEGRGLASLFQSAASISANSYQAQELIPGNIVWRAMKSTGFESVLSVLGSSQSTLEDVMSFTGTEIACVVGETPGCTAVNNNVENAPDMDYTEWTPTIELEDLVEGTGAPPMLRVKNVDRISCTDPVAADECVSVRKVPIQIRGMKNDIIEIFNGNGSNVGLITRWRTNTGTLTPRERGIVSQGGAFVQLAISLIHANPSAARSMVTEFSDVMAAEIVVLSMDTYLDRLGRAASGWRNDHGHRVQMKAFEASKRMQEHMAKYHARAKEGEGKLQWYATLAKQKIPSLPIPR